MRAAGLAYDGAVRRSPTVTASRGRAIRPAWYAAVATAVTAIVVASCAGPGPAPSTPGDGPATPTAATTQPASPPPGASPAPTPASQTDTTWGRIWDDLPPAFPLPPGARPTETGEGPASAILDVGGDAESTMTFLQGALEVAGFRTEAVSGPLEDGSMVLDAIGDGACRVQARAAPLGGTTTLTVLYGAACPFP